jgi:hypothetical protein
MRAKVREEFGVSVPFEVESTSMTTGAVWLLVLKIEIAVSFGGCNLVVPQSGIAMIVSH